MSDEGRWRVRWAKVRAWWHRLPPLIEIKVEMRGHRDDPGGGGSA